jgi:hypothetical protein
LKAVSFFSNSDQSLILNPDFSYAWSSSDKQQSETMTLLLNRDSTVVPETGGGGGGSLLRPAKLKRH